MVNIGNMMKQAQQLQKKMSEAQEKLNSIEVEGVSGGGMVKVVATLYDRDGNVVWEYTHDDIDMNYWIARANKYALDYLDNIILGDINSDNTLDVLDIVIMINIIFDIEYNIIADMNEDGTLNIQDVILIVNSILS